MIKSKSFIIIKFVKKKEIVIIKTLIKRLTK